MPPVLEEHGWDVLIADAQRVKGLAPIACKTDRIDARVLALLSHRDLVPAIWLPDPRVRRERLLGSRGGPPSRRATGVGDLEATLRWNWSGAFSN